MEDVRKEGRTILFVSHSMPAVRGICQRALWLDAGRIVRTGNAAEVADEYLLHSVPTNARSDVPIQIDAMPDDPVCRLRRVEIFQERRPCSVVLNGHPFDVEIHYDVFRRTTGRRISYNFV